MKARFLRRWYRVRSSYWFIPSVMAFMAAVVAFTAVFLDQRLDTSWIDGFAWLNANKPDGARSLLSTVAGSMIGVAGVTFSVTIAAVVYASGQYGPRLLTNFMRDTGNQVTLGTFISTFLYCLLVLRTIQGSDETTAAGDTGAAFVPHVAILLGLGLAIASIAVLIYFIHHVPESIHVSRVIADIGRALEARVDRIYPEPFASDRPRLDAAVIERALNGACVAAPRTGYLESVDYGSLHETAREHDLLIVSVRVAGDFVRTGDPVLWVSPAPAVSEELEHRFRAAFATGSSRTAMQDARFLVQELVEIGTRALSSGVNDPFTAITCMQWLGAAGKRLAGRDMPPLHRGDEDGTLRVTAPEIDFAAIIATAFGQLRPYAAGDRNACFALLEILGDVGSACPPPRRVVVRNEILRLEEAALESLPHEPDRAEARERRETALQRLSGGGQNRLLLTAPAA